METKLSYVCICPWSMLPRFLNNVGDFVPSQIFPFRDGKSALVEFTPSAGDVVYLVELVQSFSDSFKLNCHGEENH